MLLDHELCKIEQIGNEYKVKIRMTNGQWVYNRPFPADLRGAIAALTLSLDILSGKVILESVVPEVSDTDLLKFKLLEAHGKRITGG